VEAQLQVEAGAGAGEVLVVQVGETALVGSGPGVNLVLRDPGLAPRHAAFRMSEDGLEVIDLGAPGGTRVNGSPLAVRVPTAVESGDLIELGGHGLRALVMGRRRRRRATTAAEIFPADELADATRIGSGATGVVYRARWLPRGVDVALKLLRDEFGPSSPEYARFLRECGIVARLQSPHVVAVYDVRTGDERAYTIMELVDGIALDALLAQGPLPVPGALRVAEDMARGLAAAASQGIVHRDVKPANVLLDRGARVAKLCDFGLAKDLASTLQSLTAQGVGLGTLAYLPPEQLTAAKQASPAADVYGLGATLYCALSGQAPFSTTTEETVYAIAYEAPPRLETLRADVPPEVAQAVHAMLGKDPAQRPTAAAAATGLQALREARFPGYDPGPLFASR
jgi:Protein kinase domain/FHA domain